MARRKYQNGQILFSKSRQLWLGRYREDTIRPDGSVIRVRPQIVLGTKKELPTQRLAVRKLDEILLTFKEQSISRKFDTHCNCNWKPSFPSATQTIQMHCDRLLAELEQLYTPAQSMQQRLHAGQPAY